MNDDTGARTEAPQIWNLGDQARLFVERTDDLMTVVDAEGRFLYVNPAAGRIFGLAPEDCVGLSAWDFVHPADRERTSEAFERWLADTGSSSFDFENRQVSRDGSVRHMHWTITRQVDEQGQLSCLVSYARDVTAARRFEQDLRKSEERHKAVLAGMLDPLITIDFTGTIEDANASCSAVFGFAPEELLGQNISMLMPEPHRTQHDAYLTDYRKTGVTKILGQTREFLVLRKDGEQIECELSVSRIEVPGKDEPLFCGSFRDVTARKKAERALIESERRIRAIFDREYEFVGLMTPEGILIEANRSALEAAGVEREQAIGRHIWDARWWSHSTETQETLKEAIKKAATGQFVRFECKNKAKDGRLVDVDFSIRPIEDDDGRVVMLLPEGRDITDIKLAQKREVAMMRAFAEIGESASLLAHEIKNPITAVNAALRAVSKQLGEDEKEVLSDLVERMQKLEKTMRRTLSLARPLELHTSECDATGLLGSAALLMGPHLEQDGVKLEVFVVPDCPKLTVDAQLLGDVLTNLVRNALEAVEGGGRIRLEASPLETGVLLAVEDDGPGIPESVLATLFKPFVSTKANGTGLGLALARKIVEAHGGTIEVHNGDLGGARFEIRLPDEPPRELQEP